MKFPTQFDKPVRHYSRHGSRMKKLYQPSFDDNGDFKLVETGEANLYDEIQSYKDSVDINVLLRKYQEGDIHALERVQGVYGDFSNMPTTYSGMLNSMLQSRNIFDSLPVEIRARFDHSFEQFISAMDDPALFNRLVAGDSATPGITSPKVKEDPVDES